MRPSRDECVLRIEQYKDDPICRQASDHFKRWLAFYDEDAPAPQDISASADIVKTERRQERKHSVKHSEP